MNMLEMRRKFLASFMNRGDIVKIQQGTFVGNGTNWQTISCDFEPDIIIAECPSSEGGALQAQGLAFLVEVKNEISASYDYASATDTEPSPAAPIIYTNDVWSRIWSYSNGTMTFGRTTNYQRYRFFNGETYNYTFIKYTEDA